ncbi:hypothetical protein [Tateyamaria omphalii]|uniref:Uncharacterized protein n=1 Tax=Tateyamaria omphalii TaxID=299262 RepID=A0A1P8MX59_9RHOB|nr:hypothetical protein [Tateyamaria omphalii]APX12572.1 hypothetical protein BWR18_13445 [Tateyamaria omphalii]
MRYDDEDPSTLHAGGVAPYHQGATGAALARLNRVIDTGQVPAHAHLWRARANLDLENDRRAMVVANYVAQHQADVSGGPARKARALDPDARCPLYDVAFIDAAEGRYKDVEAVLLDAVRRTWFPQATRKIAESFCAGLLCSGGSHVPQS